MKTFQIRDDHFGLAIYDAETPAAALEDFLADRERGRVRGQIAVTDDGEVAEITLPDGQRFTASSG